MKQAVWFLLCAAVIFGSCHDPDREAENPEPESYYPLAVGNYWIYQHYKIMDDGTEEALSGLDSVYVSRDTLIDDISYYVVEGSNFIMGGWSADKQRIVRDSSGFIISNKGSVYVAPQDCIDTLSRWMEMARDDTLYTAISYMSSGPSSVTVPAGVFDVVNCKTEVTNYMNERSVRTTDNLFARDVGLVQDGWFYLSQTEYYFEKRLVRYFVSLPDDDLSK